MEKERSAFDRSLSNFIHDFASGGAIRHLADQGYTVTEIKEQLPFPTPKDRVAQTVWEHFLESGKIRTEQPKAGETIRKVRYVKEYGQYGKVSLRQVTEEISLPETEYLPCDFGIRLYQKNPAFLEKLDKLTERERQYVTELPWPTAVVYHAADDRIREILKKLS